MNIRKELKDRANPRTTGKKWRKIRNICAGIAVIGALFCPPVQVVVLPAAITKVVVVVTTVAGVVSGRAHLDKSKAH